MAVTNTEGIILRKYLLRETSYILVVFTKDFGKIRGVIKGVRKPYPQFAGDFEIFTRCNIGFYQKKQKSLDLISHCAASDSFFRIRNDIERLTYANYLIELIDAVTVEYCKSEKIYQAAIDGLNLLSCDTNPKSVITVFELKLIDALGISPQLEDCVSCSAKVDKGRYLDISNGGLICSSCSDVAAYHLKVSPGTINFLRKVKSTPFNKAVNIKFAKEIGKETETVLKGFIRFHVGKELRSLKFLRQMEARGMLQGTGQVSENVKK